MRITDLPQRRRIDQINKPANEGCERLFGLRCRILVQQFNVIHSQLYHNMAAEVKIRQTIPGVAGSGFAGQSRRKLRNR